MAAGKARHVDFHFDEYIAGVAGILNAEEQGVYWMICSLIMSEGGPVDENHKRLSMLCGVRPADIKRILASLINKGKISRGNDGKLLQKRAQSEVERSLNRIQSASERGSKGGRPSGKDKQEQQNAKATGFSERNLTTNHQPPTTNVEEKKEPSGSSKKRAARLPADWSPPSEWIDEAVEYGMPRPTALASAEKMKNWSLSTTNGVKLDWHATWKNWFKREMPKPRASVTTKSQLFGRM
ncbi:Uncharacterized conserved protein YdaU, DUF1376 family [Rhizobium mongolense subsp. loessense]|uniref:Uncharacterized conserved protein YdaU, DUF1376 family n=1 Tax=Rhizobium mongolense subsp. loessense TaxID=158890 RepID=A0A1G4Q3R4_9HYPH|nr:DUF1376 domain-containing protein [Rhizobium mongolense]SCW39243.1 Uncharacterized conserved protein YdaU, DUF1376 family [Rhizobium mongolense subsp. loessense]